MSGKKSKTSEINKTNKIKRRTVLKSAAIPLVASFTSRSLTAQNSVIGRKIRVGIIGAGANVRNVQLAGFRAIAECEVAAVANRTLQSTQRVASEFGIPKAYGSWQELLADEEIDAVLIGTWPYMHRDLTLATLESGKHVMCQARMANNTEEAREMLAASLRYPNLISQLVPTSTSYVIDNVVQRLVSESYLGDVLSVEIQRLRRTFVENPAELDWRHDVEFSGVNALNLGSTYESIMRWLGPGSQVMAQTKTHVAKRLDRDGQSVDVEIPDHVDVIYELANNAQVHMRFSETTGLSSGNQTWIHGSDGTIFVDNRQNVFVGRRDDNELSAFPNPVQEQAYYRVEEEFINAILGREEISLNSFATGVQYMEWTEAVHRSAASGRRIELPLV
jgi:predicted dehydrogenase